MGGSHCRPPFFRALPRDPLISTQAMVIIIQHLIWCKDCAAFQFYIISCSIQEYELDATLIFTKEEINQIISSADSGFELKSDTRAQDFLIQWFSTLDSYQTNGNLKSKNLRLGATISTVLRSRPLTTTKSSAVTTPSSVELAHKHTAAE